MVICPVCNHDRLVLDSLQLLCLDCRKPWPVRNAVPDLYNRYKASKDQVSTDEKISKIDDESVDLLINALDLNQDRYREAVLAIVHRTHLLSSFDDAVTAEIQDEIGRAHV